MKKQLPNNINDNSQTYVVCDGHHKSEFKLFTNLNNLKFEMWLRLKKSKFSPTYPAE